MDDEIGITPNRTREMQVVRLGQPVMSERLSGVTRALLTLQQTDLDGLFFWFSASRGKQALQFTAMG